MLRRSMVASREQAKREIGEGRVTVDGAPALKPARLVSPSENIEILGPPMRYVSRAGFKLEKALESFCIDPKGLLCLDVGSSTGGFTDCLLQHGASRVVAVDVGTHQLHERMRSDDRVEVREQTDVRTLTVSSFDEPVELVVGDVSFISLTLVLPVLAELARQEASIVGLIKPQFEAGRQEASKAQGVIRDPSIWERVLFEVVDVAGEHGLTLHGLDISPITGRSGNVEFLAHFARRGVTTGGYSREDILAVVVRAETEHLSVDG